MAPVAAVATKLGVANADHSDARIHEGNPPVDLPVTNTQPHAPTVMLKNVRLSFPDILEPGLRGTSFKPRYSATFMLPPDHPSTAELRAVMHKVAESRWGAGARYETSLKDGNVYASAILPPLLLDRDKTVFTAANNKLCPGAYVNAQVAVWASDRTGYLKRVCAQLRGVQFIRKGLV